MGSRRPPWLAEDERTWDHITVHQRVLQHPDLSIYERGVYCVLAWHANAETGASQPGQPTIGKEAGCSERRVRDAISILEATHLIEVSRDPGKPIVYRLLSPPKEPVRVPSSGEVSDGLTPARGAALTPARGAAVQIGGRHVVPLTPAGAADGPRQEVPHNKKEPFNKNQEQEETTSRGPLETESLSLSAEMPDSKKPRRPRRRSTETEIPEGFPTPVLIAEGKATHPSIDVDHQTARFVNWAKSKGITYRDWPAGYRNWLLGAVERIGTSVTNGNGHKPYSAASIPTPDEYATAIAAAEASENGWGI